MLRTTETYTSQFEADIHAFPCQLAHVHINLTTGIDRDQAFRNMPFPTDQHRVEHICDCLALAILVPVEDLNEEIRAGAPDKSLAEDLACKFCVSRELIFRQFRDRGLVTNQEFIDAKQEWDSQPASAKGSAGGNYYRTKIAYLGEEYVALAFKRFHQDRIDEEELADYLAIKPKHLDQLEDALFEVSR